MSYTVPMDSIRSIPALLAGCLAALVGCMTVEAPSVADCSFEVPRPEAVSIDTVRVLARSFCRIRGAKRQCSRSLYFYGKNSNAFVLGSFDSSGIAVTAGGRSVPIPKGGFSTGGVSCPVYAAPTSLELNSTAWDTSFSLQLEQDGRSRSWTVTFGLDSTVSSARLDYTANDSGLSVRFSGIRNPARVSDCILKTNFTKTISLLSFRSPTDSFAFLVPFARMADLGLATTAAVLPLETYEVAAEIVPSGSFAAADRDTIWAPNLWMEQPADSLTLGKIRAYRRRFCVDCAR